MTEKIKSLVIKYKSQLAYLFFGGCTTLINIVVYWLSCDVCGVPNTLSVAIAWVVSVLFAFVTNKLFVFESRSTERNVVLREGASFFLFRLLTFALDLGIMFVAVDLMQGNNMLWKILSNIIVIILNYFLSKLLVFKKK